jgi:hypothetical protein
MGFHWWPTRAENNERGAAASKAIGGALVVLAGLFAVAVIAGMLHDPAHGEGRGTPSFVLIALALVAGIGGLFWLSGHMAALKQRQERRDEDHTPSI